MPVALLFNRLFSRPNGRAMMFALPLFAVGLLKFFKCAFYVLLYMFNLFTLTYRPFCYTKQKVTYSDPVVAPSLFLCKMLNFPLSKRHENVTPRAVILGSNMHQIVCRLELHHICHWGSLQRSPDPLAVFSGLLREFCPPTFGVLAPPKMMFLVECGARA